MGDHNGINGKWLEKRVWNLDIISDGAVGEEKFSFTLLVSLAGLIIKSILDTLTEEKHIFNFVHTGAP